MRILAALIVLLSAALPGRAADTQTEMGGTVRLVVGPAQPGQTEVQGALVVSLRPGFKTYWKRPGDSGVPTRVTFDGSENLEHAELLFPTPVLHVSPGDRTASYEGDVVFPIRARRIDPSAPLALRASGMLGMCAEICIPVAIALETKTGPGVEPATARLLFAGLNQLPREAHTGVRLAHVERDGEGRVVALVVNGPNVRPRPVLFVASDTQPDLVPYATTSDDGPYRFAFAEPVRGPAEVIVSFGGTGARFHVE